jgi:protein-tyrosine phosphatase
MAAVPHMPAMQSDRHIPLQGASNFRDFGGYPTADGRTVMWRRLFRSDRLSDLTPADYETLSAHDVRVVYDLRRDSETAAAPTAWPGPDAPEMVRSPLFNDESGPNTFQRVAADETARHDADLSRSIMRGMYVRMVTEPTALAAIGRIFKRLARPGAVPALFHCSGGKDRTGVTCALILSALGVSREDVTEDFMLTARYYDSAANLGQRVSQIVAEAGAGFWSEAALLPIFGVERGYIDAALDHVEAAGGAAALLTGKAGVSAQDLERLREQLLD